MGDSPARSDRSAETGFCRGIQRGSAPLVGESKGGEAPFGGGFFVFFLGFRPFLGRLRALVISSSYLFLLPLWVGFRLWRFRGLWVSNFQFMPQLGFGVWGFQFVPQLCFALCSLPSGLGSFASLTPPNAQVRSLIPLAYKLYASQKFTTLK